MKTEFDYGSEMWYGNKHLQKVSLNRDEINLEPVVTSVFKHDLSDLHNNGYNYTRDIQLGTDCNSLYHIDFYNKIRTGWPEFYNVYYRLCKDVILPYLNLDEALVQITPTFRVHLPNSRAIAVSHYDSDEKHCHPKGEVNFIYALTDMFSTNTIWCEKTCRYQDYVPIEMSKGECICLGGNTYEHFNKINVTGVTRVSLDFRVLPLNYYDSKYTKQSVTMKTSYKEGEYYKRIRSSTYTGSTYNVGELFARKNSDTLVIFGSGPSVGKLSKDDIAYLSLYDTISFNNFYMTGISTKYYILGERLHYYYACIDDPDTLNSEMPDCLNKLTQIKQDEKSIFEFCNHVAYDNTLFIIWGKGAKHYDLECMHNRHDHICNKMKQDKLFMNVKQIGCGTHYVNKSFYTPENLLKYELLLHQNAGLNTCIYLGVSMGYKRIIFSGVDGNNFDYALPELRKIQDVIRNENNTNIPHPSFAHNVTFIEYLKDTIQFEVYNMDSALTKIIPIHKKEEEIP